MNDAYHKVIKAEGGNFATVALWEAAAPGNLTLEGADTIWWGELEKSASTTTS